MWEKHIKSTSRQMIVKYLMVNFSLICISHKITKMRSLVFYLISIMVVVGYHHPPLAIFGDKLYHLLPSMITTINFNNYFRRSTLVTIPTNIHGHLWQLPPPTTTVTTTNDHLRWLTSTTPLITYSNNNYLRWPTLAIIFYTNLILIKTPLLCSKPYNIYKKILFEKI